MMLCKYYLFHPHLIYVLLSAMAYHKLVPTFGFYLNDEMSQGKTVI